MNNLYSFSNSTAYPYAGYAYNASTYANRNPVNIPSPFINNGQQLIANTNILPNTQFAPPGCVPFQTWYSPNPIYDCPMGATNVEQCLQVASPNTYANFFVCER